MNETELGDQEWCDDILLWYVLDPPDLPKYCDGCNDKFTIFHALNCKRGGLVVVRHNNIQDRVIELAFKAFTPSHVSDGPFIFAGCVVERPKVKPSGTSGKTDQDGAPPPEATEKKGDLLIRDLWKKGNGSVHNMRVVNTDAKTHTMKPPEKCLQEAERGKKRMYLEACLHQCRHFYPFVASVDGLTRVEATATLKMLAS